MAAAVLLAAAAGMIYVVAFRSGEEGGPVRIDDSALAGPMTWAGPIPGVQVELEAGLESSALPGVPILEPSKVSGPCVEGLDGDVALLQTWTDSAKDGSSAKLGFVYTQGIWMSVGDLSLFSPDMVDADEELTPIEEIYEPKQLFTTDLRGHVAWAKQLDRSFSCDGTIGFIEPGSQGALTLDPVPSSSERIMYDGSQTASLRWVENGVVIHLVGPFDLATLKAVADHITWRD